MNGIDLLIAAVGLLLLLALWTYLDWRQADRYRRLQRKAHRNLNRIPGPR